MQCFVFQADVTVRGDVSSKVACLGPVLFAAKCCENHKDCVIRVVSKIGNFLGRFVTALVHRKMSVVRSVAVTPVEKPFVYMEYTCDRIMCGIVVGV